MIQSVYGKLIGGFLVTILFSFSVAGYISLKNNNDQIATITKEKLKESNHFVYEVIHEVGIENCDDILSNYAYSSNFEVEIKYRNGAYIQHGGTIRHGSDALNYFESVKPYKAYFHSFSDVLSYGEVFNIAGNQVLIVSHTDISSERDVFVESAILILGCVFLSGSVIFLVLADFIVKPITKLTNATKELSKGNYHIRVKSSGLDEISRLNTAFNQMAIQLDRQDEIRQKFISDISHEFQTPLTAIQGFANILKDEELTKEQKQKYANIILFNSKRLSTLSRNMLHLTLLENDDIELENTKYCIDEQLSRVISMQETFAAGKDIEIQFVKPKKEIFIEGDEDRLEQVWINVLSNAIKYTNEHGLITVEVKRNPRDIEIRIEDTGIGMSADVVSHIFERFYREDKARSVEGNGLGLSIVKSIVDLHGGKIDVLSDVDVGTTFIIKLPLKK